jgi:hypothetical protein
MSPYIATLITFAIAHRLPPPHGFSRPSRRDRKPVEPKTHPHRHGTHLRPLCWLMFTDVVHLPLACRARAAGHHDFNSRWSAWGMVKDEAAVKAMSRTGDPREILRGPLFYGIVFVAMTSDLLEGFAHRHPRLDDPLRRRRDRRHRRPPRQISDVGSGRPKKALPAPSAFSSAAGC